MKNGLRDTALAAGALAMVLLLPLVELAAANPTHGLSRSHLLGHYGWMLAYAAGVAILLRLILFRVPIWRILTALVPVTFLFFVYGKLNALLRVDVLALSVPQPLQSTARLGLLASWMCVLALVFWMGLRLLRTKRATHGTLIVVAVLLLIPALRLMSGGVETRASLPMAGATSATHAAPVPASPNVYWLVADAYPRADVLREEFAHDNAAFEASLADRGFVVPRGVMANYPLTFFSVASMGAMDYVVGENTPAEEVRDIKRFIRMVGGDNELVRSLRALGYRYVHFASGYEQSTLCSGVEDLCILGTKDAIDEVSLVLLRRTPLLDLGLAVLPVNAKFSALMPFSWRGFDALEDHLAEIRSVRQPFLLYAHILDPHPPFRHNADCSIRPAAPDLMQWVPAQRPAFVAEIQCVNLQLGRVLDEIIAHDPQAVIVINGDHGSAFRNQFEKAPEAWTREDVRERFAPLLALRLPARCQGAAEKITSLVNVFRVVRSCLSGVEVPLLPDRQFVTNYNDSPYFGIVVPVPKLLSR